MTTAMMRANGVCCRQFRFRHSCVGRRPRSSLNVSCLLLQPSDSPVGSHKPPRSNAKMRVDKMFSDTHEEMLQRQLRVMHVKTFLSEAYYFNHPDDVWTILSKDDLVFGKSSRVAQSSEWLGSGIFSQLDAEKHAAARHTLNPAFRKDYLAHLDRFMMSSALQLRDILAAAAAAAGGGGSAAHDSASEHAGVQRSSCHASSLDSMYSPDAALEPVVDMQRLFRLLTLDTIGLTSLDTSFDALQSWQQQQGQQQQHVAKHVPNSSNNPGGASMSSQLELEQLLCDLESAFLWQSLQLPLPRSWLPGWTRYIAACDKLNALISSILADARAEVQQRQQAAGTSDESSSERQTLVSFLLAAQQKQGHQEISDQQICDEIKTIIFAGTDTSAFTLAMCAYQLALHPSTAARAAAEVQQLLQQTGRQDVSQLTAGDASKMPWVAACLNETLRLSPAGPVMTRTALQDTQVGGYTIPKGMTVAANVYSLHRHPDIWPRPTEWLPQRWLPAEAACEGLSTHMTTTTSKCTPFLPFSTGARSCIGRNYALLQMELTLAVLLGSGLRFRPTAARSPPELVKSLTLHAKDGVWLTPCVQ